MQMNFILSAGYLMASAPPSLTRTVAKDFTPFLTARVPVSP